MKSKTPWYRRLLPFQKQTDQSVISQLVMLNGASWSARTFAAFTTEAFQGNATVRFSIRTIGTAAKSCPIILRDSTGAVVPKHELLNLLAKPNPNQSWTSLLENALVYRFLGGEAPVWANRLAPLRPPKELWVLRPDWLETSDMTDMIIRTWDYYPGKTDNTIARNIPAADLLLWREFNALEPLRGLSILWSAAKEIDLLNQYNEANKALLDNGMQPSGVFSTASELSDTAFKRLKSDIDSRYSGSGNIGRPVLLEGGLAWQQSGLTPKDAEFPSGTKAAKVTVLSLMGVPAQLADIDGSKTFANFEQARAQLYEDTVIPLVNDFLNDLAAWLMPCYPDLRGKGYTLSVDIDSVAALDVRRSTRNKDIDSLTSLKINEKRQAMGYADDPDGDVILVDSSKVPLELSGATLPAVGGG